MSSSTQPSEEGSPYVEYPVSARGGTSTERNQINPGQIPAAASQKPGKCRIQIRIRHIAGSARPTKIAHDDPRRRPTSPAEPPGTRRSAPAHPHTPAPGYGASSFAAGGSFVNGVSVSRSSPGEAFKLCESGRRCGLHNLAGGQLTWPVSRCGGVRWIG